MAIQIPNQVAVNLSHDFVNAPTPQGLATGTPLTAQSGHMVKMSIIGGMRARVQIAAQLLSGRDIHKPLMKVEIAKALQMADKILAQDHREAEFRSRLWECRSKAELDEVAEAIRGEMEKCELPSLEQWLQDIATQRPELRG